MSKKSEVLIIDCQVMQTNAWDRGMGKYSLSLIAALNKLGLLSEGKTYLMLNENLPADESMLAVLSAACPEAEIAKVGLALPNSRRGHLDLEVENKAAIDKYIQGLGVKGQVDFLALALFLDQAYIVFPSLARKLLLFYDLIPFIFEERYAPRINYDDYLTRFRTIFEADLIFTISQTVADDMAIYLGIPAHRLHNINGASIDRSRFKAKKPDLDLSGKYILMNSGDELRKNNLNAVKGFAEFCGRQNPDYSLVITSIFSDNAKKELGIYSDSLIFTGNIPDDQLQWLYENAELIFCPSEYEGLGLPVLEAMSTGKKIACSDIPVFREISNDAFYFFDPLDPSAIAATLDSAIKDRHWNERHNLYPSILAGYTWDETARAYSKAYQTVLSETSRQADKETKPKIAVFTPPPSGYSGIGKMTSELHASLSGHFDIDYYYDFQKATDKHIRPDFIKHLANCYNAASFDVKKYKKYLFVVYHLGNSDYHLNIIKNALYLPGFAILHDTNLEGAYGELKRLDVISPERFELERKLNSVSGTKKGNFLTSVLNNQLGVITHSHFARGVVEKVVDGSVASTSLNLPVEVPQLDRQQTGKQLRVGLGGILADIKGLPLIESLANDQQYKDCQFTVFGFSFIKPETIDHLQSLPNVKVHLDPTDFEFQTQLSKLDVLINFRFKYQGETSLTTLEAMRYGVIPFISKEGWYGELPDSLVMHVQDEFELRERLLVIMKRAEERQAISQKMRDFLSKGYSHEHYARQLSEFVNAVMNGKTANIQKSKLLKTKGIEQVKAGLVSKSQ